MTFNYADSVSVFLFSIFSIAMFLVIVVSFKKAQVDPRYFFGYIVYLMFFSLLVLTGAAKNYPIPVAPILLVSLTVLSVYFALSEPGRLMAKYFSFAVLVGFHIFRLALEIILHHWSNIQTIPQTMTWSGQNWDIVTGILALVVFPFANRNKKLVWVFEIIGTLLLANVLRVVLMSSPFPFSWELENPLLLILYFPYALIGPLFVGPAIFGHIVLLRKLRGLNRPM